MCMKECWAGVGERESADKKDPNLRVGVSKFKAKPQLYTAVYNFRRNFSRRLTF